ncbi:hypothetical protein [Pseudogemmobacter faecipullorum]|uniref:DUF222 domain-containing protein n=1 Tax=Pseudogemmobacter faecipullorum TaxID=2755041 RepID=A0ABS8CNS4_9RHOB|nr:hypothetical protein [Pseudogemmobacter faecipullorum]MCB5410480.1 hypothetical protein [Pseudogemmobacter faecipullorum]
MTLRSSGESRNPGKCDGQVVLLTEEALLRECHSPYMAAGAPAGDLISRAAMESQLNAVEAQMKAGAEQGDAGDAVALGMAAVGISAARAALRALPASQGSDALVAYEARASAAEAQTKAYASSLAHTRAERDHLLALNVELQATQGEPVAVTLGGLRPIWKANGGSWHGPRVEHWTIPEDNMVKFFTEAAMHFIGMAGLTAAHPSDASLRAAVERLSAKALDYEHRHQRALSAQHTAEADRDAAEARIAELEAERPALIAAAYEAAAQHMSKGCCGSQIAAAIRALTTADALAALEQAKAGAVTDGIYTAGVGPGFSVEVSKREAGKAKSLKMASVTGVQPIKFQADVIHITPASAEVLHIGIDLASGPDVTVLQEVCRQCNYFIPCKCHANQPVQGGEGGAV